MLRTPRPQVSIHLVFYVSKRGCADEAVVTRRLFLGVGAYVVLGIALSHGSGYVRNDVLGTGHGNDYGAFQQVDRDRRDSYSHDDDGDFDDDEDYGDEDDGSDWDDGFTPEPPPRRRRRRTRRGNAQGGIEEDIGGCVDGIGGCAAVIFGLILLYQVIKYLGS